jgi:2-polyprenyl-3-methyl-5-hydroxy-6-metoxy-1,4-benzoquinol methylase
MNAAVKVSTERVESCPNCGGRARKGLCRAWDRQYRVTDQAFAYVRCLECDVCYQSPRPRECDIARLYPTDDYEPFTVTRAAAFPAAAATVAPLAAKARKGRNLFRRSCRWFVSSLNRCLRRLYPDPWPHALERLYTPDRPGQVLLDFGCGSEHFLDRARARGWKTLGVDFIPEIVANVRAAGHDALLLTPEMWRQIPDGSLDLVRLNHVIEHLYQPRAILQALRKKMKPGARIHIGTPNSSSLTFKLLGARWFPLDCPRHVMIFSPRALRRLLSETGFTQVRIHHEVLTKDIARSVGFALEDLGRVGYEQAIAMHHRPALAELLFPPARVWALLGLSDRQDAVARNGGR